MPGQQAPTRENTVPAIWGEAAAGSPLDIIVFSKDRACQLDALLRSLCTFLHFPHRITVVYTSSTPAFELGYDLLRLWHMGVNWLGEAGSFDLTLMTLLDKVHRGPGRYLMFLVDDMLFTRTFTAQGLMESLSHDEDILAVALRMGENITYCYSRDSKTAPPDFSKGCRWAWKTASPGYWDYPMSLDGNIFRTADLVKLLPKVRFANPNTLEAALAGKPLRRPELVCERSASVINVAANRVQSAYLNRCGNLSAERLNAALLKGSAIDFQAFAGQAFDSCHIDRDLPLVEDSRPRNPPEPRMLTRDGKPHRQINLTRIPVFVINCPEDAEKRKFIEENLYKLDLNFEIVNGLRMQPGWVGIALAHLKVLRLSRAKPPFLVLEDDCVFNEDFYPVLDVPAEAAALYLGVSAYGLQTPGEFGWGVLNRVTWQRYDEHYLRVYNMLARHAVLYLDEGFCQAVIESQLEALANRDFSYPGDIGLARLQASHLVLTPNRSACQQAARDTTHINLPVDLPDNEIKNLAALSAAVQPAPSIAPDVSPDISPGISTGVATGERKTRERNAQLGRPMGLAVLSHKYRFIYFPIAKNASSTLRGEFSRPVYECTQLPANQLPAEALENYFKFTFLRDPVTRAVSAYQQVSMILESKGPTLPEHAFATMDDSPARFTAFVQQIEKRAWDGHVRPQSHFLSGISLDFYGRVETLQRGLALVFDTLGLGACPILPVRYSREGRKTQLNYSRFLVDHEQLPPPMLARIRQIYRDDIDLIRRHCPDPALYNRPEQRDRHAEPGSNAPMAGSAQALLVNVKLRDGRSHKLQLPADSPLLVDVRLLAAALENPSLITSRQLLQLPINNGSQSLAFASQDVTQVRIIPAAGLAT